MRAAMDAALRATVTGEGDSPATPAGGSAVPVVDFADTLAELSAQTPHAETSLVAVLDAMETISGADFRRVAAPAARAERLAAELRRPALRMRARLIRADVLLRQGDAAGSGRIARQVNAWATEHGDRYVLARSHRQLALFFRHVGDLADALAHAVQSVAHVGDEVPARIRGRHLATLAIMLVENGSVEEALRRCQEALDIAAAVGDFDLSLRVLNNLAYTAYENDDHEHARDLVERMRSMQTHHGVPLEADDLDTIARVEMMHGRYAEAEETLRPVLDGAAEHLLTDGNTLPACLLTVAEAQRLRGDVAAAQATLDQAARVCEERDSAVYKAQVREEQAQLYAATGRYREAYEEYRLFHAESQALQSAQREARARTLQAVFETEEARRESLRFRELAQRDALTGLRNRRYVDEHLALLLDQAAERGAPLSVALVDLDHFKRVNDTHSHATGDVVLQQVAALLTAAAAAADAVAARLGGEEFLLILPDTDADMAMRRCERLRQAIHEHAWQPVTGDVPVTASIGITTNAGGDITASALLAQADRNLYAAKRAGRNRVVGDPTATDQTRHSTLLR